MQTDILIRDTASVYHVANKVVCQYCLFLSHLLRKEADFSLLDVGLTHFFLNPKGIEISIAKLSYQCFFQKGGPKGP